MKRLKIALVFISFYIIRWLSLGSSLPSNWTPESKVRFTATVIEQPEYTDTNTIVRVGLWYINLRGYAEIIPGSRVSFTGKVEPKVLGKMTTKIIMMDPTFEVVTNTECVRSYAPGCVRIWLLTVRERWVNVLEKSLPEPMSSLAAGILLGIKGQMPKDFYTALVNTGTLHIVAASGYNVTIVAAVIMNVLNGLVGKTLGVAFGVIGIVVYVLIAGAGASVVRAGIMGSLTLVAFYFGRPTEAKRLLYIAAGIMLLLDPVMIFDIGFQLSFLATFGLLYLEPVIRNLKSKILKFSNPGVQGFLAEYLYPTLAASIATLPVILYQFGRASYISPLVNMMVLPVVPLIMGISAMVIGTGMIFPGLGQIIAWALYPLLSYMVEVIMWFG